VRAALIFLALAAPAVAQTPRPAPAYFVDAAHDLTAANALAVSCSAISVNPVATAARSQDVMDRLAADGFDVGAPLAGQMADPVEVFAERRADLLERHGLNDAAPEDAVCAAARAEIAGGTGIGALLLEVGE
jgi:hypothetical protein